jgi:wobble nucleotide-excising tRNase
MNLIERKNQQIGELGQEIKDLEKENEFVNALILHLVRQSKGMKDVVEKLSDHPDISTSVIY